MKVILPLIVVAVIIVCLLPIVYIYFANDIEQNVTVTGSNSDAWTAFLHGNHLIAMLMGNTTYLVAIIIGIVVIVIVAGVLIKAATS
jgi:uncharacterized membrane protein YkgB